MNILLVAKPWRGGLASYLYAALDALLPGSVSWLPTYPRSVAEKIAYRKDRAGWRTRLAQRIAESSCDAAIFINHIPEFEQLDQHDRYLLWVTDDPRPLTGRRLPYARVFISDPGYRKEVAGALSQRFGGVVGFACLPSVHHPGARTDHGSGFCFIGNRDTKRDPYLRTLCEAGKDIRVYGNYFPLHRLCWRFPGRFRPAVPVARMSDIYARHRGSINIHAEVVKGGTNMRTYECAGYRIAQIVERLPGLEAVFSPGEDLLTFQTPEELISQMSRLEQDPELARSLAASAARRARAEHTYFHRARALLAGVIDVSEGAVTRLAGA
ncbi:MAG: glycosyltransferase [Gammaproteobacteria bacterium]|nr:glycosyltransferase [Gammaproteobacteria bacterium]